jgi:hypothetical protein
VNLIFCRNKALKTIMDELEGNAVLYYWMKPEELILMIKETEP